MEVKYFVARHENVKFPRIFYVFLGLIFLSCETVHLAAAGIFWWPLYRFSAFLKSLTATVSCVGVIVLTRVLPKALEFESGEAYRREVSGRQKAEALLEFERNLLHTLMNYSPDAILHGDADRVRRGAHTLKGSADVFEAQHVVEQARLLEEQGHTDDLRNVDRLLIDLSAEVETLVDAIRRWIETD